VLPNHLANDDPDQQLPYQWRGPFCYSLRCAQCRAEVPHTWEEHDRLRYDWSEEDRGL
jgi:hypothetical protein